MISITIIGRCTFGFVTIHILLMYSNIKRIKCHSPRIDLEFEKEQHVFEGNWKVSLVNKMNISYYKLIQIE